MDKSGLRELARRWWPSRGADEACDAVDGIVRESPELVPELLRALIEVGPEAGDRYVGTSIVEDLIFESRTRPSPSPIEMLRSAGFGQGTLFGALTGVYQEMLEEIDIRQGLADLLSSEQIAWLLGADSPHRWANDGTMVADGQSVRFKVGETEWMQLYGNDVADA